MRTPEIEPLILALFWRQPRTQSVRLRCGKWYFVDPPCESPPTAFVRSGTVPALLGHTVTSRHALHYKPSGRSLERSQVGVWLLHETVPAGCVLSRLKIELPDPSVRHEPASSSTDLGPVWGKSDAGGY